MTNNGKSSDQFSVALHRDLHRQLQILPTLVLCPLYLSAGSLPPYAVRASLPIGYNRFQRSFACGGSERRSEIMLGSHASYRGREMS